MTQSIYIEMQFFFVITSFKFVLSRYITIDKVFWSKQITIFIGWFNKRKIALSSDKDEI